MEIDSDAIHLLFGNPFVNQTPKRHHDTKTEIMKLLITRAIVADSQSPFDGKTCDILIQNGVVVSVKSASSKTKAIGAKVFDAKDCIISPGFTDMRASIGEPGFEFKETILSAAKAAASGGYTRVAVLPNTLPVTQNKNDIISIYNSNQKTPVTFLPYGAITNDLQGKELNELYDMHQHGAVGFSDANNPISHAGVLLRALEYAKIFNGLILVHAHDKSIAAASGVSEGITATYIGTKGVPNLAEEVMIARDIELLRYSGSRLHISHLSSKGSVDLIRKAKKSGLNITCDVAVANLIWTEEMLDSYDSNFKLNPPLRTKADQKALWDGLIDGTIDCISTDHTPQDTEHKVLEFEYAQHGMIQLQTALSLILMHAPKGYDYSLLAQHLSINARKILNQPAISVKEKSIAEFTIFHPTQKWEYNTASNKSLSSNSPVLNTTLTGKAIALFTQNEQFITQL